MPLLGAARYNWHACRLRKLATIDNVKDRQQCSDCDAPMRPASNQRPEKRNVLEIAEKERRAHWQERAADIAHDEDEEGEMKSPEARFVHLYPRRDQEHGSSDGADNVRKQGTERSEERRVGKECRSR